MAQRYPEPLSHRKSRRSPKWAFFISLLGQTQPPLEGINGFAEWAFEKRPVVWLAVVVGDPGIGPLRAELADVLEAAADQRQHVLQAGLVGHGPLVAAGDVDRRGVGKHAA